MYQEKSAQSISEVSQEKAKSFKKSGQSVEHSNAIIANNLKQLAANYKKEERYRLADYLTEWTSEFPLQKSIIDLINIKLRQRFYEEYKNNRSYSSPNYINDVFKTYTSTPQHLMNYFLGEEKWERVKNRVDYRTKEEELQIRSLIEKYLENNLKLP